MFANPQDVPVLFLIYSRLAPAEKVFERIREFRPKKLYISGDGPRAEKPGEDKRVEETRAIAERVDWDCEVHTIFAEENLGCRRAITRGINWFFEHNEAGIVLEDDCVPDPTFFRYCFEMLNHYWNDRRIMHIAGSNFQFGWTRNSYSYYYSNTTLIWGWASWRRAWQLYDAELELWPEIKRKKYYFDLFDFPYDALRKRDHMDLIFERKLDTWDYQWSFTVLVNGGLSIIPNMNLISNIGYGTDATHTSKIDRKANLPFKAMEFPLKHPPFVFRDKLADYRYYSKINKPGYTYRFRKFMQVFRFLSANVKD